MNVGFSTKSKHLGHLLRLILPLFILLFLSSCDRPKSKQLNGDETSIRAIDLPEITEKGKLTILAENSSISFFIYRGKKMGFEYELLKEYAQHLGVDIEVKIVRNLDNMIGLLNAGEGDLIACNYGKNPNRMKYIDFTKPYMHTPLVLVQRKPDGWEKMHPEKVNKQMIRDLLKLAHKKIPVWRNSSYFLRLINLQDEICDSIYIQAQDGKKSTEEMIELVSEGEIDYTVAEKNVALINQRFLENIDIKTFLSVDQKIGFGIRKTSPLLKASFDQWLTKFKKKKAFKHIYAKYFIKEDLTVQAQYGLSSLKGQLSNYDKIFKKAAKKYDFEWLLLASVSYHESRFNPNARGFGGAYSIMQFMPGTGPKFGVYPNSPVEVQINGGAKKLGKDYLSWEMIPDRDQREKFTLATYNAGRSHIEDAQRLAEKHGMNPLRWDDNVEVMMLNLSKAEYYRDPVVKNGALRGARTYRYVRKIYAQYLEWKTIFN
jgi:membrane-bound lytic murein transglycosylase F